MDANATPHDSARYQWGRYRDNYPRATARALSIRAQVDSWVEDDTIEEEAVEETAPLFNKKAPPTTKTPDHSRPRERKREYKPPCKHEWVNEGERGRIIERPPYRISDYMFSYYIEYNYGSWLETLRDPVRIVGRLERCRGCNNTRLVDQCVRELNEAERNHWMSVRGIDPITGERYIKQEVDVHKNRERKRKQKKAGRKRKC